MGKTEHWSLEQYRAHIGGLNHDVEPKTSKYRNQRCVIDGIGFDSRLEAAYYLYLKHQRKEARIAYFHRQVPFDLPGNTKYRVDFQVVTMIHRPENTEVEIEYIDVKGRETPTFKLKRKQVEHLYPVKIRCVTKSEIPDWCINTVSELMSLEQ